MQSKSKMTATLENEKPEIFHLITVVYKGGAKVSFFAIDFEVQRNQENGQISSYSHQGVDVETYEKLKTKVFCEELVFGPLALGDPEEMAAVFTSPVSVK